MEFTLPAPLPLALRERVVAASERPDMTIKHVASIFQVGTATVKRYRAKKRNDGSLLLLPRKNGLASKRTPERLAKLREIVESQNDLFGWEIAERWTETVGMRMTRSDVLRGLHQLGLTLKKRTSGQPNKTSHESMRSGSSTRNGRQRSSQND